MSILYLLIPTALILALAFLSAFFWGAADGQFEDLETPRHRILSPDSIQGDSSRDVQSS